jgi:hypothetical protein
MSHFGFEIGLVKFKDFASRRVADCAWQVEGACPALSFAPFTVPRLVVLSLVVLCRMD